MCSGDFCLPVSSRTGSNDRDDRDDRRFRVGSYRLRNGWTEFNRVERNYVGHRDVRHRLNGNRLNGRHGYDRGKRHGLNRSTNFRWRQCDSGVCRRRSSGNAAEFQPAVSVHPGHAVADRHPGSDDRNAARNPDNDEYWVFIPDCDGCSDIRQTFACQFSIAYPVYGFAPGVLGNLRSDDLPGCRRPDGLDTVD